MHVLFEVHIAPGADPDRLLSAEVLQDTKTKLMTWAEARAGNTLVDEPVPCTLSEPPAGNRQCALGCARRQGRRRWAHARLVWAAPDMPPWRAAIQVL